MTAYITYPDVYEFTKLLIEIGGIYHVDENFYIRNNKGQYLARPCPDKNFQELKILDCPDRLYKILDKPLSQMDDFEKKSFLRHCSNYINLLNCRSNGDGKWLFSHIENICACLLKQIIVKIVSSLCDANSTIINPKIKAIRERRNVNKNHLNVTLQFSESLFTILEPCIFSVFEEERMPRVYYDAVSIPVNLKLFHDTEKQEHNDVIEIIKDIISAIFPDYRLDMVSISERSTSNMNRVSIEASERLRFSALIIYLGRIASLMHELFSFNLKAGSICEKFSSIKYYYKKQHPWILRSDYLRKDTLSVFDEDGNPCVYDISDYSDFLKNKVRLKSEMQTLTPKRLDYHTSLNPGYIVRTDVTIQGQNVLFFQRNRRGTDTSNYKDINSYIGRVIECFKPQKRVDETSFIIHDKVIAYLLMTLEEKEEIQKWLPGTAINGRYLTCNGIQIDMNEHIYNPSSILKIIAKYNYASCMFSQYYFNCDFNQFIVLYAITNGITDQSNNVDYSLALKDLCNKFKINGKNIFEPIKPPPYSSWLHSDDKHCYKHLLCGSNFITFKAANGALIYSLLLNKTNDNDLMIFPVINMVKKHENSATFFAMPDVEKFPLLNLDHISQNSHATIIITSDIILAYEHGIERLESEEPIIWTTWYGGEATIKRTDWEVLKGRKVYYLCLSEEKEDISIALKVLNEFDRFSDVTYLNLLIVNGNHDAEKYEHRAFIELAKRKKVYIPEEQKGNFDGCIDVNQISETKSEFIIDPIIEDNTKTMIYAPPGNGKTWLALSIALAITNGKDVFKGWATSGKPKGVAYFAGEMSINDLKKRISCLDRLYKQSKNEYLLIRRVDDIDLSNPEGQKCIDKYINTFEHEKNVGISLLILDNLNTLAAGAITTKGWNCLLNWLNKKENLATIIIHHPNKDGKYLGTSNIQNKIDLMIYAGDKDDMMEKLASIFKDKERIINNLLSTILKHDIAMFISPKKMRLASKDKFKPFWLSLLNVNDEDITWQVDYPDYEDYLDAHGYSLDKISEMLKDGYINNKFEPEKHKRLNCDESLEKENFPKGKEFINLPQKMQEEIIKKLYFSDSEKRMTSQDMARILGICKRKLDEIRKITSTRKRDLGETP